MSYYFSNLRCFKLFSYVINHAAMLSEITSWVVFSLFEFFSRNGEAGCRVTGIVIPCHQPMAFSVFSEEKKREIARNNFLSGHPVIEIARTSDKLFWYAYARLTLIREI